MGTGASNQVSSKTGTSDLEGTRHASPVKIKASSRSNSISSKSSPEKPKLSKPNPKNQNNEQHQQNERKNSGLLDDDETKKRCQPTEITKITSFSSEQRTPTNHSANPKAPMDTTHHSIQKLQKELAESESNRLDLQDKVKLIEDKHQAESQFLKSQNNNDLQETLQAKDSYILKLERDSQAAEIEAKKLRMKLKKRIRGLTNQMHEIRQESSVHQMELQAEIAKQKEEVQKLMSGGSKSTNSDNYASPELHESSSHSKIVIELSSQLSEQSEEISSLRTELAQKDRQIAELQALVDGQKHSVTSAELPTDSARNPPIHNSTLASTATDRLHSSRGLRTMLTTKEPAVMRKSETPKQVAFTKKTKTETPDPIQRQSTALSDSDSDWEIDSIPSHTHSAPARVRVKSAMSSVKGDQEKNSRLVLNGDDDSLIGLDRVTPVEIGHDRSTPFRKKSSLRNHLEHVRKEKQTNALMGPTLAFGSSDPFSDTSCEPTPRSKPSSRIQTVVNPL